MARARWGTTLPMVLVLAALATVRDAPGIGAPADAGRTLVRGTTPDALAENSQRKLIADSHGELYLAYPYAVDKTIQIVLAISGDLGRSWRRIQVSQSAVPSRLPSLAVFPDDSIHLVWTEYVPLGRVRYRAFRGGRWSADAIISETGVYAGVPVVAPLRGEPHVLWYGIRPDRPQVPTRHDSTYEILFTRARGRMWSKPVVISPGVPDSINPSLGVVAVDRLEAAWFQFDGHAYQVRVADFGGTWSRPRSITTGGIGHTRVALAVESGEVYLVWEEDSAIRRVMYRRRGDGASTPLSGPASANDPVIDARDGMVVAAWSEAQTIMLRRLKPAGPTLAMGQGSTPVLAVSRGVAYLAWTRAAGSSAEIRFAAVALR